MSVLIAIPARGGSKRLRKKNILPLKGKPMIVYTIEAAIKSKLTNEIWVCTDDDEIENISLKYNVQVFKIPKNMAKDNVSSTVPCISLIKHLKLDNKDFEYLFNLQPTSPLRSSKDIIKSLNIVKKSNADFLVSVTDIDPHYFHWAMTGKGNGWRMFFRDKFMKERIYLDNFYRPNGAIKLAKINRLLEYKNFFGKNLTVHYMPDERSIHVGNRFDFECVKSFI